MVRTKHVKSAGAGDEHTGALSALVLSIMKLHGVTSTQVAKTLNVTRSAVSQAISGRARSERIESHIARKVGLERERLFGPEQLKKGQSNAEKNSARRNGKAAPRKRPDSSRTGKVVRKASK